ncbi:MAG: glycosyltransferase family 2 protein [Phyllobacteriaceae bacterium]|nr:glycosyltransferase family 2 protein [Phyllobacteriaceae bacterium]
MGEAPTAAETSAPRVLVVTAYYKEDRALIERTIRSVATQTAKLSGAAIVDHLLVADGFPQDWIDGEDVRHLRLDRAHADYGNTPRGVGSLLAISEGYDALCYCDADNWYQPNHVAMCLKGARAAPDIDYVVATRTMRRPDESILPIADEAMTGHVDTNCFFFLPGSYDFLHLFSAMPREMSSIGDRLFYAALRLAKRRTAVIKSPTVNYLCLWESVYQALGETPPPGAKPSVDGGAVDRWLATLDHRERTIVARLTGLPLSAGPATVGGAKPAEASKVLVITAYHGEDRATIERCLDAVARQSVPVDHLLVADGRPQAWIDGVGVRHVRLDREHGDFGNTPRGVGVTLAISEGYDALCFVDADNWPEPNHVEACLAAAAATAEPCDWVLAKRFYHRPDGSWIPIGITGRDVDTNCLFFLRGSFHLLHHFAAQPKEIAERGDVVFHDVVLERSGLVHAEVAEPTLHYTCWWETIYRAAGEEPPAGARALPDPDRAGHHLAGLDPRRQRIVARLIGLLPD